VQETVSPKPSLKTRNGDEQVKISSFLIQKDELSYDLKDDFRKVEAPVSATTPKETTSSKEERSSPAPDSGSKNELVESANK